MFNFYWLLKLLSGLAVFSQKHTELVHGLSVYFLIMAGMVFARILKRDSGEQVYDPVFTDKKLYIIAVLSYVVYSLLEAATNIRAYEEKGIHGLPIFIGFVGENVFKTLASDSFQVGLLKYLSALVQAVLNKKMDVKVDVPTNKSSKTPPEITDNKTPEKEESYESNKGGK